MKGKRIVAGLLPLILCASTAGGPSTWEPRTPEHKAVYPQVYDRDADVTVNLFNSTSFRTRNTLFLGELADSMRTLREQFADTAGKKYAILSLWIGTSGAVDSAAIDCDTIVLARMRDDLRAKALSWHFTTASQRRLLVIQDLTIQKKTTSGFYKKNKKKVWIGGALFALLLFFL